MPYKDPSSKAAKDCFSKSRKKYASSLRGKFATRYNSAKERCNEKSKRSDRKFYVGIAFKYESLDDFTDDLWESFVIHADKHGISNTTLDRIDPSGNYEKGNCQWATRQNQSKNRKDTIRVVFRNKELCLTDWARELGMSRITLFRRIYKYKWTIEKAFTTPVGPKGITNSLSFYSNHETTARL